MKVTTGLVRCYMFDSALEIKKSKRVTTFGLETRVWPRKSTEDPPACRRAKEPRHSPHSSIACDRLLSSEFVTKHKKILLDAVALYQTTIEKKWSQVILENPDLSILPDLKRQIESSHEIEGAAIRLLQTAVAEYRKHLESLNKDSVPWVKMDNVNAQLQELDEQDFKEDLFGRSHEASEHVT